MLEPLLDVIENTSLGKNILAFLKAKYFERLGDPELELQHLEQFVKTTSQTLKGRFMVVLQRLVYLRKYLGKPHNFEDFLDLIRTVADTPDQEAFYRALLKRILG